MWPNPTLDDGRAVGIGFYNVRTLEVTSPGPTRSRRDGGTSPPARLTTCRRVPTCRRRRSASRARTRDLLADPPRGRSARRLPLVCDHVRRRTTSGRWWVGGAAPRRVLGAHG